MLKPIMLYKGFYIVVKKQICFLLSILFFDKYPFHKLYV